VVNSYIGSKYGEICAEAGTKKLYSNSHIYVVDSDFVLRSGGMGYVYNWTQEPITKHYRVSGTSYPNQKLYSMYGDEMDIEIVPDKNRKNFYNIYWNPEQPLQPGEFFNYGWASDSTKQLSSRSAGGKYSFIMQNNFGDHCYETFFLAVPQGTVLSDKSEEYTGKGTVNNWDIYWWKKIVQQDENHIIKLSLQKPPYTQQLYAEITKDGVLNFKTSVTLKNDSDTAITTTSFINSDFVNVTAMYDDQNRPIEFTSKHQGNIYRYNVTFNEPVLPGETIVYSHEGTMKGLVKQVPNSKDTFWYHMVHSPAAGQPTLRIETFLLPKGAELISTTPSDMKQDIKNGRIELHQEKLIPVGGNIVTQFQYKLSDGKPSKKDKMAAENLTSQGWKLWGQRKLAEAEEMFKQATEKDPTNDNAYQGLGWAQLNQGKKLNARDSFEKCIKLNPKNSAALNGLGWIAHGQSNIDDAVEWWEKAVKASNGTATASLSGLTQVYMNKQEYDKAIKYYRMWLKAEPNNKQAKEGLEKARELSKN